SSPTLGTTRCSCTCASSRSTAGVTRSSRCTLPPSATPATTTGGSRAARAVPALGKSAYNDRGRTVGHALVATDGGAGVATSLIARPSFDETSNGLLGRSDGWTDLENDHRLDEGSAPVGPGNVVQTGRIRGLDGSPGHQRAT